MTPSTLLALARAVYPQANWIEHESGKPYTHEFWNADGYPSFDPENKYPQTLVVLCWLMNENPLAHWDLTTDGKQTPQSLAAAIVKAAGAVIEAKENPK